MFCSNCGQTLALYFTPLSQDNIRGDWYTHECKSCKSFWHVHVAGNTVSAICTDKADVFATQIKDGLKQVLQERISKL